MKKKSVIISIICVLVVVFFCSFRIYTDSEKNKSSENRENAEKRLESEMNLYENQNIRMSEIGLTIDTDECDVVDNNTIIYSENK